MPDDEGWWCSGPRVVVEMAEAVMDRDRTGGRVCRTRTELTEYPTDLIRWLYGLIYSSVQLILFTECVLRARHFSRCWGYSSK